MRLQNLPPINHSVKMRGGTDRFDSYIFYCSVEKLGLSRYPHKVEVAGSNPAAAIDRLVDQCVGIVMLKYMIKSIKIVKSRAYTPIGREDRLKIDTV